MGETVRACRHVHPALPRTLPPPKRRADIRATTKPIDRGRHGDLSQRPPATVRAVSGQTAGDDVSLHARHASPFAPGSHASACAGCASVAMSFSAPACSTPGDPRACAPRHRHLTSGMVRRAQAQQPRAVLVDYRGGPTEATTNEQRELRKASSRGDLSSPSYRALSSQRRIRFRARLQ